jgi:hypothetical protein
MATVILVKTKDIRTNQEASRLDPELVRRSITLLANGWDISKVPPVKGYFYKDHMELTDGHHRLAAALALRIKEIPAVNEAAMRSGDKSSYAAAIRKYRKLISHPLAK